jgi:hypothetical protein
MFGIKKAILVIVAIYLVGTVTAEIPEWTFKTISYPVSIYRFKGTTGYYRDNSDFTWRKVNLLNDTATVITEPWASGFPVADISGPYATYSTPADGVRHDLLLYNGTNTVTVVPYDEDITIQHGDISGDYIVWEQWDNTVSEVRNIVTVHSF